jgi:uncharacterized protein YgbK (DUF1537 family)
MCILALADDMTGALEVGAKFQTAGIPALISARPLNASDTSVIVFDTETRHSSPEAAGQEIRRFVLNFASMRPRLVYKKTDSTLRGNISAELRALADLFPKWRIGYAPAYPALGRTVKKGVLYVDGIAVAKTAFAHDILNPVHDSSVCAILEPQLPCTIFDGATDADLATTAAAILSDETMCIAAGPAGLAAAIAQQLRPPGCTSPLPKVRRCLVMNGSLHEHSAEQVQRAEARRCISRRAGASWRIVQKSYDASATPTEVGQENGRFLLQQITAGDPDAVLVIGGDTAFALIAALGLPTLIPIDEVVPGIPVSRVRASQIAHILPGRMRDLLLITKAGGFGPPEALCRIRELLDP